MSANETKECPFCAETIKAAARGCRFCGTVFPDEGDAGALVAPAIRTPFPSPLIAAAEVSELLAGLVEKSLVLFEEDERGCGRYHLLETVRQYARDRLLEAEEGESVRGRHRDWFLELAELAEPHTRHGDEQLAWLDRLEEEHDNLRAALAWSAAQGDTEAGLQLSCALSRFWDVRGYFREGQEHLVGFLSLTGAAARTLARARALFAAGVLARHQGEYGTARALLEESLAILRELGHKRGIASLIGALSLVHLQLGDYQTARAHLEEGTAIVHELGDWEGIAWSLWGLGTVTRSQGDPVAAQASLVDGLAIFRGRGQKHGVAWSLDGLARAVRDQGEYGTARALLEESLTIFHGLRDRRGVATELEGLAAVAVAQAQPERAARLFGAANSLREAMGAPLPPSEGSKRNCALAAVRAALGEPAFSAASAEGRAMSLQQAIDYALEPVEGSS